MNGPNWDSLPASGIAEMLLSSASEKRTLLDAGTLLRLILDTPSINYEVSLMRLIGKNAFGPSLICCCQVIGSGCATSMPARRSG